MGTMSQSSSNYLDADPNRFMYRLRYLYTLLFLLLGASEALRAQNVSIQTHLDRAEIRIGERAAIDMTIRTDNLPSTRFRLVEDTTGVERFRILEFGALDTVNIGGGIQEIKARMIITSFDSTLITIPPIIVETPTGSAVSKPLALNVISPEVDLAHPDRFKPIQDPWEEPYTLWDILVLIWSSWITYVVILLALIALLIYEHKRRAQYLLVEKPIEVLPTTAFEVFLNRVNALGGHSLDKQEDFKEYYTELTAALRTYWSEMLHIEALEKTSSELLEELRQHKLDTEYLRVIEELFCEADYVKFAKSLPQRSDTERLTHKIIACTKDHHLVALREQEITQAKAQEGKEVTE